MLIFLYRKRSIKSAFVKAKRATGRRLRVQGSRIAPWLRSVRFFICQWRSYLWWSLFKFYLSTCTAKSFFFIKLEKNFWTNLKDFSRKLKDLQMFFFRYAERKFFEAIERWLKYRSRCIIVFFSLRRSIWSKIPDFFQLCSWFMLLSSFTKSYEKARRTEKSTYLWLIKFL